MGETYDAFVFVVDAADEKSLGKAKEMLHAFYKRNDGTTLRHSPLLILANKQDKGGAVSVKAVQEALQLNELNVTNKKVAATSAVTLSGCFDGFRWLAKNAEM
mmetsp:Transcript_13689/g.36471  ORF Transcript_13689/g.36471 Transcript_13689/m.36471 type:complete len:103 (+) Transcript_13689:128-436(+)